MDGGLAMKCEGPNTYVGQRGISTWGRNSQISKYRIATNLSEMLGLA